MVSREAACFLLSSSYIACIMLSALSAVYPPVLLPCCSLRAIAAASAVNYWPPLAMWCPRSLPRVTRPSEEAGTRSSRSTQPYRQISNQPAGRSLPFLWSPCAGCRMLWSALCRASCTAQSATAAWAPSAGLVSGLIHGNARRVQLRGLHVMTTPL